MVEWKKLGEVCTIIRGNRVTKGELVDNGKFPVISGGVTPMGFIDSYNREANTVTVSQYGTAGYVDFQHSRFWANDICYCVYPQKDMDNKYLWYVLKSKQNLLYAIRNTDAIPYSLPIDTLKSVSIPIPSLSEQTRIVGILDTFTSAIDNLKEQIAQRRKQYEYYRDQLLDLEGKEGVEMKTLKELSLVITDGDHMPPPKTNIGIPFITISNINKDINDIDFRDTFYVPKEYYNQLKEEKKPVKGDVLYTVTGSYGIPVYLKTNKEFCFQRHIGLIRIDRNLCLPKYCFYWLGSKSAKRQAEGCASGGAQKTVSLNSLRNFILPIPSLQEQQRIVSILDTFEASIQNLEAQLSQREKQYEYYRNKLLTFEE